MKDLGNRSLESALGLSSRELMCDPGLQTQWWHYNGHLASDERRFGFQLTFFRRRTDGEYRNDVPFAWPGARSLFFGQFSVSNLDQQTFHVAHRRGMNDHNTRSNFFHVQLGDWMANVEQDCHRLTARSSVAELDLQLRADKPGVLNGRRGKIERSAEQVAQHISFSRLAADGSIMVDGKRQSVTGSAWLDRESGVCDFCDKMAGWDWMGIQLDDNRELMVYQVCDKDRRYNQHQAVTLVHGDGSIRQFNGADFQLRPDRFWTSPWTQTEYPIGWELTIPEIDLQLKVRAQFECQELDTRGSTNIVYWEGAAQVTGRQAGNELAGHTFVELVGYHRLDRRMKQKMIRWWELLKNEFRYRLFSRGRTLKNGSR